MQVAEKIKNWKGKPKELLLILVEKILVEPASFGQVVELLEAGSKVER